MEEYTLRVLQIEWDGPFNYAGLSQTDWQYAMGLYQIYGTHEVHGPDTLLYIGETITQSFEARIQAARKGVADRPGEFGSYLSGAHLKLATTNLNLK